MSSSQPPAPVPDGAHDAAHVPDFAAPGPGFQPAPALYPAATGPASPAWPVPPTPPAYPAPPNHPAPPAYPAPPSPPAPPTVPAATSYPTYPTPTYPMPTSYPAQPAQPAPTAHPGYASYPPVPGTPVPAVVNPAAGEERVGRGLLFSLGGIVVGIALTVVMWKLSFFASFTSLAMAYSVAWLYTKGAGRAPSKGAPGVIAVIVLGVAACLASLIATDTLTAIALDFPEAPVALQVRAVAENVFNPGVWQQYTREVFMYLLFAALGTVGLIRQLGRARRA